MNKITKEMILNNSTLSQIVARQGQTLKVVLTKEEVKESLKQGSTTLTTITLASSDGKIWFFYTDDYCNGVGITSGKDKITSLNGVPISTQIPHLVAPRRGLEYGQVDTVDKYELVYHQEQTCINTLDEYLQILNEHLIEKESDLIKGVIEMDTGIDNDLMQSLSLMSWVMSGFLHHDQIDEIYDIWNNAQFNYEPGHEIGAIQLHSSIAKFIPYLNEQFNHFNRRCNGVSPDDLYDGIFEFDVAEFIGAWIADHVFLVKELPSKEAFKGSLMDRIGKFERGELSDIEEDSSNS